MMYKSFSPMHSFVGIVALQHRPCNSGSVHICTVAFVAVRLCLDDSGGMKL